MAQYIESEAVNKLLQKEVERTWHRVWGSVIWELYHKISQIPTADVVEVVHGEWINDFGSYSTMHCSKCEWRVPYIEDYWAIQELYSSLHNCPNCGAKMDGEKNEAN